MIAKIIINSNVKNLNKLLPKIEIKCKIKLEKIKTKERRKK